MKEEKQLRKAYDANAERYLFTRSHPESLEVGFQNREIEQPTMFSLIPKNLKGKKLLDLGCGPGIHLRKYYKRGAICSGVDLSSEMIRLAKKQNPKIELKVGSVYKINFKTGSFDIITASFVMDHVSDLKKAVCEIKRVLKKGGLFIFSIPHPTSMMFRNSKGAYVPTNSYYDNTVYYYNLAGAGHIFPDYPRILQEYFDIFLKNGFELVQFVENKPNSSWKRKYKKLYKNYLKMPVICFFKWKKR